MSANRCCEPTGQESNSFIKLSDRTACHPQWYENMNMLTRQHAEVQGKTHDQATPQEYISSQIPTP